MAVLSGQGEACGGGVQTLGFEDEAELVHRCFRCELEDGAHVERGVVRRVVSLLSVLSRPVFSDEGGAVELGHGEVGMRA